MQPVRVDIARLPVKLDAFLTICGAVQTGGEAKVAVQSGRVLVNGEVETRRGRKLVDGDRVTIPGAGEWVVNGKDGGPSTDGA